MLSASVLKNRFKQATASPISQVLHHLMQSTGINEAELARKTKVPQTTLNRLLTNPNVDPRTNTIKPIADFFDVSIDQLLGYSPLSKEQPYFVENNPITIPVLNSEQVLLWQEKEELSFSDKQTWITTEKEVDKTAFAIFSEKYMEPRFKRNSILIIDMSHEFTKDKFVLLSDENNNIILRQLIFDGQEMYLKNFDKTLPSIKFDPEMHYYLGTVIEARTDQFD